MNKEIFIKTMTILFSTFRGLKPEDATLDIWFKLLNDLSSEELETAIIKICRDVREIYPTTNIVALIREQIIDNIKDQAILAWESVLQIMENCGSYESVQFADKAIHNTIDMMGGWIKLCEMTSDEEKWRMKEFLDIYKTMSKRGGTIKYLPGRIEVDNTAKGFFEYIKPPIQIGAEYKILPDKFEPELLKLKKV